MPFNRPLLTVLNDRIQSDLGYSGSTLRRALSIVIGRAMAAVAHGLHGHLDYASKQISPTTADEDSLVSTHVPWWLNEGQKAAGFASGSVTATGTDGAVISTDDTLQDDAGQVFFVTSEALVVAGTATVLVAAEVAGITGNMASGETLNFISPVVGVNSQAMVIELAGGSTIEDTEVLRTRLHDRVRKRHTSGNANRYESWALEVAGVTRAWCFDNWYGIGTVGLFFVRDDDASFVPDATQVAVVQSYIDARRSVGMAGFVALAPTLHTVDMTIQLSPNTADVRAAVSAEIASLFKRHAQPEDGNGKGKILLSHIRGAVINAQGVDDHVLASPLTNVLPPKGQMAALGTLTFEDIA